MPSTAAVETALAKLGLRLPSPSAPAANYVPFTRASRVVFISGQIPRFDGVLKFQGKLGAGLLSIEQGQEAARLCALNIVSQAQAAAGGDLGRIKKFLKLEAFVNCTPDFVDHPKVINGASDLLVEIFGRDIGEHARFAVGCSSLPFGVAVEIGAVVELAELPV